MLVDNPIRTILELGILESFVVRDMLQNLYCSLLQHITNPLTGTSGGHA